MSDSHLVDKRFKILSFDQRRRSTSTPLIRFIDRSGGKDEPIFAELLNPYVPSAEMNNGRKIEG